MKARYLILAFMFILVLSCVGCIKMVANETTMPTVPQTLPITTTPETTTLVTTISNDQAIENYITQLKNSLNLNFGAELTKFSWSDNNTEIIIAYSSKNTTDTLVKKEMYDIAKSLTDNGGWVFNAGLELDAATSSGENFKSITNLENMMKLGNLGLTYDDWLKVAFG